MIEGLRMAASFGRRDPTLFIAAFALWALFNGISLAGTENAFVKSPTYLVAREIGLDDNIVGGGMLVNAVILVWGLGMRPPRVSAIIAMSTGILWCFWAFIVFAGGLKSQVISANAGYSLFASLALMRISAGYAIVIPADVLPEAVADE